MKLPQDALNCVIRPQHVAVREHGGPRRQKQPIKQYKQETTTTTKTLIDKQQATQNTTNNTKHNTPTQ